MSSNLLFVLTNAVKTEKEAANYRPFGRKSIQEIINEASRTARQNAEKRSVSLLYTSHVAFTGYLVNVAPDQIPQPHPARTKEARLAIINCEVFEPGNDWRAAMNNTWALVAFVCGSNQSALLIENAARAKYECLIPISTYKVSSDGELINHLAIDLFPQKVQNILDAMLELKLYDFLHLGDKP